MNVVTAFDRAADYDRHATVQHAVAGALAARISALPLPVAPRILEIGCGTGLLGAALLDRLSPGPWLMTDIAPAMIARARQRFAGRTGIDFAAMDGQRPDVAGPFDLVCSSLAAQWLADLPAAVARWRRLLAPGGFLAFTTLATGTFAEWRNAHRGVPAGTHDYPAPDDLAALDLDVSVTRHGVDHADASAFLRALKAIGAGTPRAGYRPLAPADLRGTMTRFDAAGAHATYVVATCVAGPLR